MVKSIAAAFVRRIDALDWMAPATKAEAKAKLADALRRRRLPRPLARTTSGLEVRARRLVGNVDRAELFESPAAAREARQAGGPERVVHAPARWSTR